MNVEVQVKNPRSEPFIGAISDVDGHCYVPPEIFREITGEPCGRPTVGFLDRYVGSEEGKKSRAVNRDELYNIKGTSASDPSDRAQALDDMGKKAQTLFPNTYNIEMRVNSDAARAACWRYNDYILFRQKVAGSRSRPPCEVNMGNVEWAVAAATRIIKLGATHITILSAEPPGGVSPTHNSWDPYWHLLAERDKSAVARQ